MKKITGSRPDSITRARVARFEIASTGNLIETSKLTRLDFNQRFLLFFFNRLLKLQRPRDKPLQYDIV